MVAIPRPYSFGTDEKTFVREVMSWLTYVSSYCDFFVVLVVSNFGFEGRTLALIEPVLRLLVWRSKFRISIALR